MKKRQRKKQNRKEGNRLMARFALFHPDEFAAFLEREGITRLGNKDKTMIRKWEKRIIKNVKK